MPIYYVEIYGKGCTLIMARNTTQAKAIAAENEGRRNVQLVRQATVVDIAHVRAMGGWVPEDEDDND